MQYPFLRTIQSALHFTSLTDLFTQTPSRLLWEASSHMLHLMREGCSYTYPSLSIARYSFIQLSELVQCRVNKLAQGFNTAAQDSNPGSRSRESKALPLSHCALRYGSEFIMFLYTFPNFSHQATGTGWNGMIQQEGNTTGPMEAPSTLLQGIPFVCTSFCIYRM